jgi:nicotine blue oxidoreductase
LSAELPVAAGRAARGRRAAGDPAEADGHVHGAGVAPRVGCLVLAAGAARRFGAPKQLARLDGRPLLEHALRAATSARGVAPVIVTLGANAEKIAAAVDLCGARPVPVPDWEEGLAASLRAGVAALDNEGVDAIVVTLGDQPLVTAAAIERVAAAASGPAPAARATWGGVPGHPVLLTRPLFAAVAKARGDEGARPALAGVEVAQVDCGPAAVTDVDTPAALEALARRGAAPSAEAAVRHGSLPAVAGNARRASAGAPSPSHRAS